MSMTPDQLVAALSEGTTSARAILQLFATYPTSAVDLNITIAGQTFTVPGLAKQRADLASERTADRLSAAMDLTGAVVSQTVTRDVLRRISSVRSKLTSGHSVVMTYARTELLITSIVVTVEDAIGNVVMGPLTRTVQRTDGLFTGIN